MLNIRLLTDYLLHRVKANNRHGIHSPFVYKLIDTVIYDYSSQKVYREFENIGPPPHSDKPFTKPLKTKALRLLFRLINHFKPDTVVNYIMDNGIDTVLKHAVPRATVLSTINTTDLKNADKSSLIILNADSGHLPATCLQNAQVDTIVAITGIYQNKNAKQAWDAIKVAPQVKVTIDLFYFGLVFFKEGMSKENFMVRY